MVIGKVKPTPRGPYDPDREYKELDVLEYEGSSFWVESPFKGITPVSGNGYVWLLAAKGEKGDPLPFDEFTAEQKEEIKGEPGVGLTLIAGFDTIEELRDAIPSPGPGDAYGVKNLDDPSIYDAHIYDVILGDWRNYGPVAGVPGKSAYEQYLEGGGTLSLLEFIAALSTVGNKVDKEEGKGLSSNDYTTGEKDKLSGIEDGANNYIHPDDENTRHVTDEEKAIWNGKADGDHTHDDTYQPLGDYAPGDHGHDGVYQPAGSYAAAGHDHDDKYQAKGDYQPAGSYASADHNHSGTYQPVGDYATSGHNHEGVYQKVESGKGLSANDFTADYKTRLDSAVVPTVDIHTVTSLASLPVNKYNIKCTYSSSTPTAISFASTPAEGFECILSILNSTSADITQAIPNATGWQSDEDSVTLTAGKVTEISIRYIHGKYIVRT